MSQDCIATHKIDPREHLDFSKTNPHVLVPNTKQLADTLEPTVEAKLKDSIKRYQKYVDGLNEHVPPNIQRLFNDLSKQYQCEWRDADAIFLTEFDMYIRSPYGPKNCEGGSDIKARQRVRHILEEFSHKSTSK